MRKEDFNFIKSEEGCKSEGWNETKEGEMN